MVNAKSICLTTGLEDTGKVTIAVLAAVAAAEAGRPTMMFLIKEAVRRAASEQGMAVLLVEQHVRKALAYADRAYVMRRGRLVLQGTARDLASRIDEIEESYLSGGEG